MARIPPSQKIRQRIEALLDHGLDAEPDVDLVNTLARLPGQKVDPSEYHEYYGARQTRSQPSM
ncbi:MAG: hypothetical protein H5T69_08120 [Chloroflexi bacterium]|nr:hypothetical protein [Chloroflexota bacterium]